MFDKFLKGSERIRDDNPDIRREAVLALNADKAGSLQPELADLAKNDPDDSVRLACLEKLTEPDVLGAFLSQETLSQAAATRIALLISAGNQSTFDNHPLVLGERLLAANGTDESKSLVAIIEQEVFDVETLHDLLLRCKQEQRDLLLALSPLQHNDALNRLERRSRGHDKSLNRYAREGLDQIKQFRQRGTSAIERAGELAIAMEKHRKTKRNTIYFQRQQILAQEFKNTAQTYEECAEILKKRDTPLDSISGHQAVFENLDEEPQETPNLNPPVVAADPFPELVNAFEMLFENLKQGMPHADLSNTRQTLTDTWLSAADTRAPEPAQHAVFETVSHAFRELTDAVDRLEQFETLEFTIEKVPSSLSSDPSRLQALWQTADKHRTLIRKAKRTSKQIAWPDWAKPDSRYTDLLSTIDNLSSELTRIEVHEHEQVELLDKIVDTLGEKIDNGASRSAVDTLNKARKLSKGLPKRSVRHLEKQLNQQAARLTDLRDWQTFATAPKREALCVQMQTLADEPLNPPDQAQRIKRLRTDWNELGALNKAEDRRLAEQFNKLAERAFEPCRSYFGEQALLRHKNLEERESICAQLENYLSTSDWANADMKAAEHIMRTARSEWHRFHPVDRTPGKPLEKRFEKLQDRLYELVKNAWETNLAAKKAIVDEAKAVSESTKEVGEKVRRAKELQRNWRAVGITPRRPDQVLWQEFRGYCDEIFATRDNEQKQTQADRLEALKDAEALCEELAGLLDTTRPLDADDKVLRDLQQRFRQLNDIPERSAKAIERRFDELARDYRILLREKAAEAQFEELIQFKGWDEAHSKRELAHLASETTPFEVFHPAFADREKHQDDDVPVDVLRMLTIRAELAAGLEVPAEESEMRLRVQVEALKRGLGQRKSGEDDPMEMVSEWCATGPKRQEADSLRDRFFVAIEKYLRDG